jgi:ATPase subunit of ABC transporter with duplicated ATPase domains
VLQLRRPPGARQLTFDLQPGDILGVVGPNGTGKTTLLKLIIGKLKPDSGTVTVGPSVQVGYIDQERESLDPQKSVWQEITDGSSS